MKKNWSNGINSLYITTGIGSGGSDGNGCARFVEIATQTVNLTNILTNLNSSVTNMSEPKNEPTILSTNTSPTKLTEDLQQCDALNQAYNPKSNNGHCIIDGNPNSILNDGGCITQMQSLHHSLEIADIDDVSTSMLDTYHGDSIHSNIVLKHDSSASVPEACASSTDIGRIPEKNEVTASTAAAPPPTTTATATTTVIEETDIGKKHVTTTDGLNGAANDLHV